LRLLTKIAPVEPEFVANARRIAALAHDRKAQDVRAYDVRELTPIADAFLVCTATSEPQVKAVYSAIREGMREIGMRALHAEGTYANGWLVLDYGTIIVHIFRKEAREYYDLDTLWGDAPRVELDLDEE
jgi:ribosome-associated protein